MFAFCRVIVRFRWFNNRRRPQFPFTTGFVATVIESLPSARAPGNPCCLAVLMKPGPQSTKRPVMSTPKAKVLEPSHENRIPPLVSKILRRQPWWA